MGHDGPVEDGTDGPKVGGEASRHARRLLSVAAFESMDADGERFVRSDEMAVGQPQVNVQGEDLIGMVWGSKNHRCLNNGLNG